MPYSFIDDYSALPVNIAKSAELGIGTYRVYLNSSSTAFTASAYGISRVFAVDCINETVFAAIQDRLVGVGTSSIPFAGKSTGSNLLVSATIPAGKVLFGDYNYIKLTSGLVVLYGI